MNGKHDHTIAVCIGLRMSGDLHVVQSPALSWHGVARCEAPPPPSTTQWALTVIQRVATHSPTFPEVPAELWALIMPQRLGQFIMIKELLGMSGLLSWLFEFSVLATWKVILGPKLSWLQCYDLKWNRLILTPSAFSGLPTNVFYTPFLLKFKPEVPMWYRSNSITCATYNDPSIDYPNNKMKIHSPRKHHITFSNPNYSASFEYTHTYISGIDTHEHI